MSGDQGDHKVEPNLFKVCMECSVIAAVKRIILEMYTVCYVCQLPTNQLQLKIDLLH
jgi:hypothetical protein